MPLFNLAPFRLNSSTEVVPISTAIAAITGNAGGLTLTGGTGSADLLTLKGTTHATRGYIAALDVIETLAEDRTITASPGAMLHTKSSRIIISDFTSASAPNFITNNATFVMKQSANAFGMGTLFGNSATYINDSTVAANLGPFYTFMDQATFKADTQSITMSNEYGIRAQPVFTVANGGTLAVTNIYGASFGGTVNTGVTLTNRYGVKVDDFLGTGSPTNQYGIDIAALSAGGTSNIGVRIGLAGTYSLQLSSTAGTAASGITFGTDTNLYRSAANTLKTDDGLTVLGAAAFGSTGQLTIGTTGGLATSSSVLCNGSGNAPLGYTTGAGGTVTQITSKSTAVTLDKPSGKITMNNAALASGAVVSFTVNCAVMTANAIPIVSIQSGATAGAYTVQVEASSATSFNIQLRNDSAGSLSEAVVLMYAIIRGITT